ncbi:MAG: PEP-CTERM sorting domain-containing protein [bacterium]
MRTSRPELRPADGVRARLLILLAVAVALVWLGAPLLGHGIYAEEGGLVVIEAEQPFAVAPGDNGAEWRIQHAGASNFRGDGFMQILPDGGPGGGVPFSATSPLATYKVAFSSPGTYSLWHRANGPDGGGDSFYARVYEETPGDFWMMIPGITSNFDGRWSDRGRLNTSSLGGTTPMTIPIATPGLYTLELAQREDGTRVDTILLDSTGSFGGADPGPAASGPPAGLYFAAQGGQVIVEAEHFKSRSPGPNDAYTVETEGGADGTRNDLFVRSGPNDFGADTSLPVFGDAPTLSYDVLLGATGTYRAWVRTASNPDGEPIGNDDSVFLRVWKDSPGDFYLVDGGGGWAWRGTGFQNVTGFTGGRRNLEFLIDDPGLWHIDLAMREDGTDIDALMLDLTGTFTGGSQLGPPESAFAIPEPTTLAILGLGLLSVLRRRTR